MTASPAINLIPSNDEQRLAALHRYEIMDTSAEEAFDNLTHIMAQVFGAPMSFISLVGEDSVFYKAQVGPFGLPSVKREDSLCSLTILDEQPLVIEDASREASLQQNRYVAAEGGIRFYAGAPLITKDGFRIGTACIVDTKKRSFSDADKELLVRFAKLVMHEIELRRSVQQQVRIEEQLMETNRELRFVTDTMPQLVWATGPDGYSFYFNKGWLEYTGLTFDEVKGDGWSRSLHPEDKERSFQAWRNAVEKSEVYDVEYRLKRFDGVYRWFVARGTPMKDEGGNILKWYGTSTDIQDQKGAQEGLQQSKERFELVSKATRDAIWDWNLLTNDILWSDGFRDLLGYSAEEIEPTIESWYGRVHPDDKDRVVGSIHRVIRNGESQWSDEYRFRKKDGSYAIVFDRGYALHEKDGTPYRMIGSMQDITESKTAQQKIKESEKRFQNLIREASVGIIVLMGEEMQVAVVNEAYGKLINHTVEELLNQPLFNIIPDAEDPFRAFLDNVRTSGTPVYLYDFPYAVEAKGQKIEGFLNLIYQPYKEADGTISGVMVLCQDVTQQVRAREKAREAEETAKLAIASAELGTFDVNLQTNEMISSERSDAIFDVANHSERHRYVEAIHPDDQPVRTQAYERAMQNGLLEYEGRVVRKNGSIRWFRVKGRVFFSEEHKPLKLVGVVQDITEEREFSNELAKQVKERTQELEQFTYVSHHDLQEPLRKIIMFTDMVRGESYPVLSQTAQSRLDKVAAAARRMSTALRELLTFASLNKEEILTELDLNEVLDSVKTDLELVIQEKEARILSEPLPRIKAVPHQMHQLWYNLLNNGLKFSRPGEPPVLHIRCTILEEEVLKAHPDLNPASTYYHIRVQDNGIGFNPGSSEKILGLFQRLHSRESYPGTGIGLALCRKVVANHEGKIWAESREGAGALFHVLLPVT